MARQAKSRSVPANGHAPQREAEAGRCLIICSDPPVSGLNGASSYNRDIFTAALDLGFAVDAIATTPRLYRFRDHDLRQPDGKFPRFLHGRLRNDGRLAETSWPARLRRWKMSLLGMTRRLPALRKHAPQVAWLGKNLSPREVRRLAKLIRSGCPYDLVLVSTLFQQAALDIPGLARHAVLIAHDIYAQRSRSFLASGITPRPHIDAAGECTIWNRFDGIIAISPADARQIEAATKVPVCALLPVIGADSSASAGTGRGDAILYIGANATHNVDGLRWFFAEVWPQVRQRCPEARLDIVGDICRELPADLPGVRLLGRVEDLDMVAGGCRFAINPIRAGSGIKVKMVDYFRLGLPCLATPVAAEGFPETPPPPFTVTDEAGFGEALCQWLEQPELVEARRDRIRDYLTLFSRETARDTLAQLLDRLEPQA